MPVRTIKSLALTLPFALCSSLSYSDSDALAEVDYHALAASDIWKRLMHYESAVLGDTYRSAIKSEDFFLSKDGAVDSEAELRATIEGMKQVMTGETAGHAACRFPARALWLDRELGTSFYEEASAFCADYGQWRHGTPVESVSLILATGYLGNPASYYGHTLIKMNQNLAFGDEGLLDNAINYGAIVPDGEDPFSYLAKGIFGGYDAGFSQKDFYHLAHGYGETELRDMWEFKLDLSDESREMLLAHSWEILGKEYTYYFFRENCAYRMAEVIEIIEGVEIIPDRPYTLPSAVVREALAATVNGKPLISDERYVPSRQTTLLHRYRQLTNGQQATVRAVIEGEMEIADQYDYDVIDTLMDYYYFMMVSDKDRKDRYERQHTRLLAQRASLPPAPSRALEYNMDYREGLRGDSRLSLGAVHHSDLGTGVRMTFRPAYYDHLDATGHHVDNSTLKMGEISLDLIGGELSVSHLSLLEIESASTNVTGLPGDTGGAWRSELGLYRPSTDCARCLDPFFEVEFGHTWALSDRMNVVGYAGGRIQPESSRRGTASATLSARFNAMLAPKINLSVGAKGYQSVLESKAARIEGKATVRYELDRNTDVRLSYEKGEGEEVRLEMGWYF